MRLPWKKNQPERRTRFPQSETTGVNSAASFGTDLEDPALLRRHAIRSLSGMLMDRHTSCRTPSQSHPFCGPVGHRQADDAPQMLVVEAIEQVSDSSSSSPDRIGLYFCRATLSEAVDSNDAMEYIIHMKHAEPAPSHKLVVFPPDADGIYQSVFGPVIKPVEGDFSTGGVDGNRARPFHCDPEPKHCEWQYWDSELDTSGWVPRYYCFQGYGYWWIAEMDEMRRAAHQVAAFDLADNPNHNFGIHSKPGYYESTNNSSDEFLKVLQENGTPQYGSMLGKVRDSLLYAVGMEERSR